jgi:GT2 family glycosyltransferase
MPVGVSVVVVSWNCQTHLTICLESLVACAGGGEREIIVVDNDSSDGSVVAGRGRFPGIRLIEAGGNLVFGAAANLGLKVARGSMILFLNPDTVVPPGALEAAERALVDRPDVGILGVRLLDGDGAPQPSCGRFLSLRALIEANVRRAIGASPRERGAGGGRLWSGVETEAVDWLTGAFLLCRRAVVEAIGGFDERYFLYAEDMDLCYRVRQHGYGVLYYPHVSVVHVGNRSGAVKWGERREGEIVRSELLFLRKHSGGAAIVTFRVLAAMLFLAKASIARLRAGWGTEHGVRARRYWHMAKVCVGWE